jgi:hypothetical protein
VDLAGLIRSDHPAIESQVVQEDLRLHVGELRVAQPIHQLDQVPVRVEGPVQSPVDLGHELEPGRVLSPQEPVAAREVGSSRGAVPPLPAARLPGPPPEPDVRLPPHPALHEPMSVDHQVSPHIIAHGEGIRAPRYR